MPNDVLFPADIQFYLTLLKRWWWLFILFPVVAGGYGYLTTSSPIQTYEATTTLIVGQSIDTTQFNASLMSLSQRLAPTYVEIGRQQPVLDATVQNLGLDYDWQTLRSRVSIVPIESTQLLRVRAWAYSLEEAVQIADEVANQMILLSPAARQNQENNENRQFIQQQVRRLKARIEGGQTRRAELEDSMSGVVSSEAVSALQSEINTLDSLINTWENKYIQMAALVEETQAANYLAITEPAQGRAIPLASPKEQNGLRFALMGLVAAAGLVGAITFLDNTIKEGDELAAQFGLTHLGSIAKLKGKEPFERLVHMFDSFDPVVEAYRMVRSNVRFKTVDQPAKLILITSPSPAEGKSTTAANLAIVMAQTGLSTIVLDADMRRPMQHYLFQVSPLNGLTELLVSPDLEVEQALIDTHTENLRILPCGELPPNPAELLESRRMQEILLKLDEMADVVIIDSPPLLAVTDASVLASQVSGVILVVKASKTRRDAMLKSVERLYEAGGNLYGVILNNVSRKKGGYYYRYRGYYAAPQARRADKATRQQAQQLLNGQYQERQMASQSEPQKRF